MDTLVNKITIYLRMIKFSHSIFALPFAFTSAIIAASGIPSFRHLLWITASMIGARSGAMGLNRIIDINIDRANPRTANRELPKGIIKTGEAVVFVIVSFVLMIFAAYKLNPLCLKLSPIAIAVLFLYSFTKRFTWFAHFVLGISISAAPMGAWIAVTGMLDLRIIPLSVAVIFWLAGFDILYALQDIDFDRKYGLHSIPQRFGIRKSLFLSRIFHVLTFFLLITNGFIFNIGVPYWIGMFIVSGLFIYEHSLLREGDLSRLNMAFFNMNGYISMTVLIFTLASYIL